MTEAKFRQYERVVKTIPLKPLREEMLSLLSRYKRATTNLIKKENEQE